MHFRYDLTLLKSRQELVDFIGIDEVIFDKVLSFDPNAPPAPNDPPAQSFEEWGTRPLHIPLFARHRIPKKNWRRGYRIVWEPTSLKSEYKALARRINNFLSYRVDGFPHPRVFGYVRGRNIRENAICHCGNHYLVSIDLKSFFPSISAERVTSLLRSTGLQSEIANLLSRFMTIGGHLPLGLPTSPTLANAICLPMDMELQTFAQQHEIIFSRYADDISLSSNTVLPHLKKIINIVEKHGFEIAESKTRSSKLGQAHYVTGLSVSDSAQPHAPRRKKRRLRQELYFAQKYGLDDHFRHLGIVDHDIIQHEVNRIDGLVKFTAYHEPRLSAQLKSGWAQILQKSDHRPSFEPKNQARSPFSIYVDEAEYCRPDGVRLLAIGMAISQHQDHINQIARDVLEDALSDQWATGNKAAIMKSGLHFSESHPDLQLTYIKRMRVMPFEGYIVMGRLHREESYQSTYIRLLNMIIKRRLMAAESRFASLVFEKNEKVSQDAIRQTVMQSYLSLKKSNNRRPLQCSVEFARKPDPGISVPDFLLGVLGRYLKSRATESDNPNNRDRKLFERIRDKYRLILDADERVEYSRRHEIVPWQTATN
jgi:hypothetical protein